MCIEMTHELETRYTHVEFLLKSRATDLISNTPAT